MVRITKVNRSIVEEFTLSVLRSPPHELSQSILKDMELLEERVIDLADQDFSFSLSVIGERILGRDYLKSKIQEMLAGKGLAMISIDLNSIDGLRDERDVGRVLGTYLYETARRSDITIPSDVVSDLQPFDLRAFSTAIDKKLPKTAILIDGLDESIRNLSGTGERGLDVPRRIMDYVMSLREMIFRNEVEGFGLVLFSSPSIVDVSELRLRKEDLGETIELVENVETKVAMGRLLLSIYDAQKTTPYSSSMSDDEVIQLLTPSAEEGYLDSYKVLETLDSNRKRLIPTKPSKSHEKLIKQVIEEIRSDDKKSYARKRELLKELDSIGFVDASSVLREMLKQKLSAFESAFGLEFERILGEGGLEHEGSFPEYDVRDVDVRRKIRVNAQTPFSYVKIDGVPAINPYPSGIVQEIQERFQRIKGAQLMELSDSDFADLILAFLDTYRLAARDDTVIIDNLLEVVAINMERLRTRLPDSDDIDTVEALRRRLSQKEVWGRITERNWVPESGKAGGVEIMGKKYTIFVWKG